MTAKKELCCMMHSIPKARCNQCRAKGCEEHLKYCSECSRYLCTNCNDKWSTCEQCNTSDLCKKCTRINSARQTVCHTCFVEVESGEDTWIDSSYE